MDIPTPYTQNMLRRYHNQMLASRTLAYRQHTRRMALGEKPEIQPEVKRRMLINRVAREVFTNLLTIGSDNPMAREVREALDKEFGQEFEFCYVPGKLDMIIYRRNPDGNAERVTPNEQADISNRAWQITLRIVDSYML